MLFLAYYLSRERVVFAHQRRCNTIPIASHVTTKEDLLLDVYYVKQRK